MRKTQKLTLSAMLVAIGTLTSHVFFIPLGVIKVFPIQHFINVLSAVMLGPYYAVAQALSVSILRNIMGTGSVFAFPGSIVGAFLAAILFEKSGKVLFAYVGEVFGTGILGAMLCYPISVLFLGKEATLFGFIPAFILSSFVGASLGYLLLKIFMKNPVTAQTLLEARVPKKD
ncbi:energy coupling factor transporter S component ThiW [Bacillus sp. DNRA2]|uniref:energy coupling factor transporter S component ThiW n=1 Tax=Bacillus sp. DNRA2 TaxID=2723053 RepID=UPI00145F0B11|nr:energy coupling factor transporter S component ThiW [Bacillus sp. DNRA2]NMD69160.1 energy coupling factor transporter S component ThiW [Bacillus sp. DNRA2]